MDSVIEFELVRELPLGIEILRAEALRAGFRFMDKLVSEWESGANRFDMPGEMLFGAFADARLVAIGGLNIDPYANDPSVARLRHLYVLSRVRRQKVGSRIARHLLDTARTSFASVRLFTDTAEAGAFYAKLGFARTHSPNATHIFKFR